MCQSHQNCCGQTTMWCMVTPPIRVLRNRKKSPIIQGCQGLNAVSTADLGGHTKVRQPWPGMGKGDSAAEVIP